MKNCIVTNYTLSHNINYSIDIVQDRFKLRFPYTEAKPPYAVSITFACPGSALEEAFGVTKATKCGTISLTIRGLKTALELYPMSVSMTFGGGLKNVFTVSIQGITTQLLYASSETMPAWKEEPKIVARAPINWRIDGVTINYAYKTNYELTNTGYEIIAWGLASITTTLSVWNEFGNSSLPSLKERVIVELSADKAYASVGGYVVDAYYTATGGAPLVRGSITLVDIGR